MLQASANSIIFIVTGTLIILFFVLFFYLFIIQLHKRRTLHQKEIFELKSAYEQTLFKAQLEIQEQTFKNISQEIHDNIGQVLSLAKLNLNMLPPDGASEKIELTEQLIAKALNDLRDLSKSLNAEKIADTGLVHALAQELNILERATQNIKTSFEFTGGNVFLSREQTIISFRIMQELLQNILKHAKAKHIHLTITAGCNETTLLLQDDGIGFDTTSLDETKTGIGLKNIAQRCKFIHANYSLESAPGKGTSVKIIIQHDPC